MATKRKKYSKEFKVETAKLVTEGKASGTEIAHDLGIHPTMVHRWVKQYTNQPNDAFPGKGHLSSEAELIRQLQRENERLKMEREILKKAMAIFSSNQS